MSPDMFRPAMDTVESKRSMREQLDADVQAFIARGGTVQNLSPKDTSPSNFRYCIHPSQRITFGDDDDTDTNETEE